MRKNLECPVSSEYEICERVNGYLRYRPVAEKNETVTQTKVKSVPKSQNKNNSKKKVNSLNNNRNHDKIEVQARKTKPGALLTLIRRLKKHEKEGVEYKVINKYLRGELDGTVDYSPFGTGYVLSIITYDPRTESALTYSQVYQALEKTPSSFDWTSLWEVIEGLIWD